MNIRRTDEDLFEESRMTFGEHLEELRKVLVRALIGVALGCVVGFLFANQVVEFLQKPLNDAIEEFRINQAKNELIKKNGGWLPPETSYWLEKENLAPRQVLVDPGQLAKLLKLESPADSDIQKQLKPYSLTAEELDPDRFAGICESLVKQDPDSDHADRLETIWSLMTEQQQQTVRTIAETGQDKNDQLLVVLNAIADTKKLYQEEAFDEFTAEPEWSFMDWFNPKEPNPLHHMKNQLADDDDPDLSRRLNKLLIQLTFPDAIASPRLRLQAIEIWETVEVNAQSLTPTEVFMIWIKAGLITGLFVASPWIFYQIWTFVAAGLYRHERRYIYVYLPFSLLLFLSGAGLAFFFVFEHVLRFLFQFNASMGIDPQPRIGYWLSFVMFLPLGFGLAFQLPLVMLFLNRVGILNVKAYVEKWRVAVFVIFLLSMILTPADPISMVTLAIPLTFLYFGGILLCYWMPKSRNPFKEAYEPQ